MGEEAKAAKLMEEAAKKAKSAGGGGGFFASLLGGGSSKVDEACELYEKAANLLKMAKKWSEAGGAFVKAAELHASKGDAKHDAAMKFAEAANCFKKTNAQDAVDCLLKSAEIYTDMGRFTMAAKHHVSIAELCETAAPDPEKAMFHYEKAGDYYRGEESKTSANKCYLKVAEAAAQLENYTKAIQIFEEVGNSAAESTLLKYSAKDYFFKALLCHLCVDVLNGQHALTRITDQHPNFVDTREAKLIKDLILCLEEQNADQLTDTVKQYDKISRLDQWHTTMLLRVKKTCGDDEDYR